jgi:hypothetical protein
MGILLDFIYPAHHPNETQHFPHPSPQKAYYTFTPPPIKTKPAPWSFVYSSTIMLPQILATTLVGCRYWILPLTHTHLEDGTSPISKSLPSFPLKVNILTLLFQQHIIVQLSHPPLIPDLPCQLPFLIYEDGRFRLNHTPHPIRPPPRITSGCSHFIWGLRVWL